MDVQSYSEINTVDTLCRAIGMPTAEQDAACDWIAANREQAERLASRLLAGKSWQAKRLGPVARLGVWLLAACGVQHQYQARGISPDIYLATMADIVVWCGNDRKRYGEIGLHNYGWMQKHVRMQLFRIGRLQYEFFRFYYLPHTPFRAWRKCPCHIGERAVFVHIPQGEPLDPDLVAQSFARAEAFFAMYYSRYRFRVWITQSWLVDPVFQEVLGETSRIAQFGKLFTPLASVVDTQMNRYRIFGYDSTCPPEELPRNNALQTWAAEQLVQGKQLYAWLAYRMR